MAQRRMRTTSPDGGVPADDSPNPHSHFRGAMRSGGSDRSTLTENAANAGGGFPGALARDFIWDYTYAPSGAEIRNRTVFFGINGSF